MAANKLADMSTEFAVKVIKMCDGIKGHYSLVNQSEHSSASIGATMHKAQSISVSKYPQKGIKL